jgi:hypothetical protein
MKIRKGFISNSSSCSFVIAGLKFDKDLEKALKISLEDDDFYDKISDLDFDHTPGECPHHDIIIGEIFNYGDNGEFSKHFVSKISELTKSKKLQELLKLSGKQESDLLIEIGTNCC